MALNDCVYLVRHSCTSLRDCGTRTPGITIDLQRRGNPWYPPKLASNFIIRSIDPIPHSMAVYFRTEERSQTHFSPVWPFFRRQKPQASDFLYENQWLAFTEWSGEGEIRTPPNFGHHKCSSGLTLESASGRKQTVSTASFGRNRSRQCLKRHLQTLSQATHPCAFAYSYARIRRLVRFWVGFYCGPVADESAIGFGSPA